MLSNYKLCCYSIINQRGIPIGVPLLNFMKALTLFCLLISSLNIFAQSELWHAHETKKATEEEMLKKVLSFILTQNRSSAGLAYLLNTDEKKIDIYEKFNANPDFKLRIGENSFRNYKSFNNKMIDLSHEIPRSGNIFDASNEALIRTSFYFKKMKQTMGRKINNFDDSFNNIQISDYRKNSVAYIKKAKEICNGVLDFSEKLHFKLPKSLINFLSIAATSRNCHMIIDEDVLELVNPYDSPLNDGDSSLEGTSIYLVKQLIPNRHFETNPLFSELLKVSSIEKLNSSVDLTQAFNEHLHLNTLETIRLINLANHNHGLEFFMLNAIIDMSENDEMAIRNVKESYHALNHLYDLINKYYEERKLISNNQEDILSRPYHFWGGVYISCELLERKYSPTLAKLISEKLGEVYELGTRSIDEHDIKESNNDILLHKLGAEFGIKYCK